MDKQEVLDKLGERIGEVSGEDKKKLEWVNSIVRFFPESEFTRLPKLTSYLEHNSSRTDSETISAIKIEVENAVRHNSRSIESNAIEYMNKKTKVVMTIFLVIIGLLAVAALVLTGISLGYGEDFWNGWCGKLASAFGTLDFALGALGFILERIDDMKKKQIRSAGEVAKETGDYDKFANTVIRNSLNVSIKNSFNTLVKIGKMNGDYVEGDKTENHYH